MGLFGGSSSSSEASAPTDTSSGDLKAALIQQVQAEAALNNARMLMSVRMPILLHCIGPCLV
jgi:hypothetical protein